MGGFSSKEATYTGYNNIMKDIAQTVVDASNKVYSNSVSILSSNTVEDFDLDGMTDKKTTSASTSDSYFANTSDKDKISINKFNRFLTNEMKNDLGRDSDEYTILCRYLEERRLGDVLDEDGKIIISDYDIVRLFKEKHGTEPDETRKKELFDNIRKTIDKNAMGEFSDALKDITIQEVVSDENGFDAIVYEKDGEYWVANTCADGSTKEDDLLILYSSLYANLGGDDFYNYISPILQNSDKTIKVGSLGEISYKEIAQAKEIYDAQRKASYDLINKYAEKGQINLAGYSMGGGIQLDSYIRYVEANPDKANNVHLDLYNPYIGFIEGNSDYIAEGKSLIDGKQTKIKEIVEKYGDNIRIYCNEGDVVSQFNSVVDCFGDSVTYLVPDESVPVKLEDFDGDVMALIVGNDKSDCRHGLDAVNYSETFDENGNIVKEGKQVTLNEIAGGKYKSNTVSTLISDAFSDELAWAKDKLANFEFKDAEYAKDGVLKMYEDLVKYIKNNAGKISYEDMMEAISPGLRDVLIAGAKNQGAPGFIVDGVTDDAVNKELDKYFSDPKNQAKVKNMIGEMLDGNFDNISTAASEMGNEVFWATLEDYYPKRYLALKTLQNAKGAWDGISSGFSSGWEAVKSGAGFVWQGIKDGASSVWEGVQNFFSFNWW